jgi:hypothetical protein
VKTSATTTEVGLSAGQPAGARLSIVLEEVGAERRKLTLWSDRPCGYVARANVGGRERAESVA